MIDEGTYPAQLVKNDGEWLQFSRSSNGNGQVLLTFALESGQYQQGFFAITPNAAEYTIQKLHACGFSGTSFREMAKQTPHGKVELVIEHDEYRGKVRPKIKFVNRLGGFSIKREDRLSLDELDELSQMATPAAFDNPPPGRARGAADSDDIPF